MDTLHKGDNDDDDNNNNNLKCALRFTLHGFMSNEMKVAEE